MTLTLTATAEPSHSPPRVLLSVTESDSTRPLLSCSFYRDGVPLRFVPTISGQTAVAYDYDAPFDSSLLYRADVVEGTPVTLDWTDTFASLAAWTSVVSGWSAGGSLASSVDTMSGAEPTIRRSASGTIARVTGVNPTVTLSAGTPSEVWVGPVTP